MTYSALTLQGQKDEGSLQVITMQMLQDLICTPLEKMPKVICEHYFGHRRNDRTSRWQVMLPTQKTRREEGGGVGGGSGGGAG